jgi:D-amino peptidase
MRIAMITDMEGISGITRWEQVGAGRPMFEEGRRLYTEDVNAAIRGAYNGGATEVVVMDWHGAGGGPAAPRKALLSTLTCFGW